MCREFLSLHTLPSSLPANLNCPGLLASTDLPMTHETARRKKSKNVKDKTDSGDHILEMAKWSHCSSQNNKFPPCLVLGQNLMPYSD